MNVVDHAAHVNCVITSYHRQVGMAIVISLWPQRDRKLVNAGIALGKADLWAQRHTVSLWVNSDIVCCLEELGPGGFVELPKVGIGVTVVKI